MKYLGCPILGDSLYGKPDTLFPNAKLMLHSRQMIIKTSPDKKFRRFTVSVPFRFMETIKILRENFPREVMPKVKPKCKKSK